MALVKTIDPGSADGAIAHVYGLFEQGSGAIPKTLEVLSASPGLFEVYTSTFGYWVNHPNLSHDLLNCIRHGIAVRRDLNACIVFNEAVLRAAGMTGDELEDLHRDAGSAPLEPNELAMLSFVLRTVADPAATTQADVDALRELGWTDGDIVDATYHGAILTTMGVLMGTFDK